MREILYKCVCVCVRTHVAVVGIGCPAPGRPTANRGINRSIFTLSNEKKKKKRTPLGLLVII